MNTITAADDKVSFFDHSNRERNVGEIREVGLLIEADSATRITGDRTTSTIALGDIFYRLCGTSIVECFAVSDGTRDDRILGFFVTRGHLEKHPNQDRSSTSFIWSGLSLEDALMSFHTGSKNQECCLLHCANLGMIMLEILYGCCCGTLSSLTRSFAPVATVGHTEESTVLVLCTHEPITDRVAGSTGRFHQRIRRDRTTRNGCATDIIYYQLDLTGGRSGCRRRMRIIARCRIFVWRHDRENSSQRW
mmetsp:Transcript_26522/g.66725  ORF Transcript_26522/g.66725 Transcript_26522/m.66725 type:complete len:249 (-) Transcript_26522:834-1580(-)